MLALSCLLHLGGRPGDTGPAGATSVSERLLAASEYRIWSGHIYFNTTD